MPRTSMSHESTGDGTPLLLLGGPFPAAVYRATVVPVLADAGYRVVSVDYRDVAAGEPAPDTVPQLAAAVADLARDLRLAPCAVVGDSLGALVAQELALTEPGIVSHLVLCGPWTTPTAVLQALLDELGSRLERELPIWDYALRVLRLLELFGPLRLADDEFVGEMLKLLDTVPPGDANDAGLAKAAARYCVDLPRLGGIRAPCLVLANGYDALAPRHQSVDVARHIPGSTVHTLMTGHGGLFECPREAADAITAFLSGTAGAPSIHPSR